jgi:hypothetical protein
MTPTKPGWYWFKPADDDEPYITRVFHVVSVDKQVLYANRFSYGTWDTWNVSERSGTWSERLEPPQWDTTTEQ